MPNQPPTFPPASIPPGSASPPSYAPPYAAPPSYPAASTPQYSQAPLYSRYVIPGTMPGQQPGYVNAPRPMMMQMSMAAPAADCSPHLVDLALKPKRRVWLKVLRRLFSVLAIAALVIAALMVRDLFRVNAAMQRLAETTQQIDLAVLDDSARAHDILHRIQADSAIAANSLNGPLWTAATHLPQVGDDIQAVRVVTDTFSDLAVEGLPELLEAVITLRTYNLGNLSIESVNTTLEQIRVGDAAMAHGIGQLQTVDQADLMPQVGYPLQAMIIQLQGIRQATSSAVAAGELMAAANQLLTGWLP